MASVSYWSVARHHLRFGAWVHPFVVVAAIATGNLGFSQTVDLEFVDDESGEAVSARLQWEMGEKRVSKPRSVISNGLWWLGAPRTTLTPREGEFEFLVHRGPEFTDVRGGFTMQKKAMDVVVVEIPRSTDMHEENWYSSDLSVLVPLEEAKRWQRGDAIDLISVGQPSAKTTTSNALLPVASPSRPRRSKGDSDAPVESTNPDIVGMQLQVFQSEWNSHGGKLLVHTLSRQEGDSEQKDAPKSFSEVMERLDSLKSSTDTIVELAEPWGRDTPILLSSGAVRAVRVLSGANRPKLDEPLFLNNAKDTKGLFAKMQRMRGKEKTHVSIYAPFAPEDRIQYKTLRGAGTITENVYWKLLDTGLRLSATAGSEFGLSETHIGYNRTYFYHESQPTVQDWINAVSLGRTTPTNGPLLRAFVNDLPPGSNQTGYGGGPIPLHFGVSLTVREHVDYLDVVFNGKTMYSAKLEEHYKHGEFPPMKIEESGWLVVRVVTANENGYRLATTSPYYFEIDHRTRISKSAVEFMQKWLDVAESTIRGTDEEEDYRPWIEKAKVFWSNQLLQANAP